MQKTFWSETGNIQIDDDGCNAYIVLYIVYGLNAVIFLYNYLFNINLILRPSPLTI